MVNTFFPAVAKSSFRAASHSISSCFLRADFSFAILASAFANKSSILCSAFDFPIAGAILSLQSFIDSAFPFTHTHFSVPTIPYLRAVSDRNTGFSHVSIAIFFALVAGVSLDDCIF